MSSAFSPANGGAYREAARLTAPQSQLDHDCLMPLWNPEHLEIFPRITINVAGDG